MSTLKVGAIRGVSASSDAITVASDGTASAKLTSINDGALSNRNLLINSAFEIWQRGTTAASGASGGNRYLADRWSVPNRTRMAQSTDVPAGFKYAILLDREQTGGSEPFTIHQGIEKDNIRKTGSYTLSFYAKSSDISSVNINVQDRTTVAEGGTNHASIVTNQAVSITSSWARYTYTFTLSNASLTGTCLRISIGNTSASQHDELLLTGIQLETGSVATDIEKRSFGQELALCQRYFLRFKNDASDHGVFCTAVSYGTTDQRSGIFNFPTSMRASPSFSISDVSHFQILGLGSSISNINIADVGTSVSGCGVRVHTGDTLTSGQGIICRANNTGSAYFDFDAEL